MFLYFGKAIPPLTSQLVGTRFTRFKSAKVCKCTKNRNPYLCGNRGKKPHRQSPSKVRGEWLALWFDGLAIR